MTKKLKNKKGQYNYHFVWNEGGFNNVWAINKREALKEIKRQFPGNTLTPDLKSLYKATKKEADEMNKIGWQMTV